MEEQLPIKGKNCRVRDFDDEGWIIKTFVGVTKNSPFKYITYDHGTDEVEEWLQVKIIPS
jgi:hypothetical protein